MNRGLFTVAFVVLTCAIAAVTGGIIAAAATIAGDTHGTAVPVGYAYAWAILTTAAGTFIPNVIYAITGHRPDDKP